MTPQFTEAGKAILNYAYQVCAEYEVPREQIGDLLIELGSAVIIGQGVPERPPIATPPPIGPRHVTQEEHDRMFRLQKDGLGYKRIANILNIPRSTVWNHLRGKNGVKALDANIPIPESQAHGATDRRADDQVPPKV